MTNKKLTVSQERLKRIIEDLLNDVEFQQDVAHWRKKRDSVYSATSGLGLIYRKYKLTDSTALFLIKYLDTNEVDYSLLSPPAYFVDQEGHIEFEDGHTHQATLMIDSDDSYRDYIKRNYLQIYISPNATINELKDFLAQNKDRIKESQKQIRGSEEKRIRRRKMSERDNYIQRLLNDGKKPYEIAKCLNYDTTIEGYYEPVDIRKIIKKLEQRKATERTA